MPRKPSVRNYSQVTVIQSMFFLHFQSADVLDMKQFFVAVYWVLNLT
jgi:hypothetical protein